MTRDLRFPQLAHWGAFTAVVRDGVLVACEPFPEDPHPSPLLGSIIPSVYSDRRIKRPAVRRSWLRSRESSDRSLRGKDDFVEVHWDEALDLVADEVRRVRDTSGSEGLFVGSYGWSSAGRLHHARSLVRRFYFKGGGGVDQVGNYSWGTAQFLLPHVIGTYSPLTGRVTSWPSIIAHTEVFVAFGGLALKNGQVSSGGAAEHSQESWLRKLALSGATVINVSPSRDDCPAFLGADWIGIRPGTDVALMLAVAFELRRGGWHDRRFLADHCTGYEQLEAYVTGQSDGIPKNPVWAEAITGVPADRITRLARQLGGKVSYLTAAFSLQRAHHGEQPYWMLVALASMLGTIGLPGGGFGFGHGSMNGVGNPRITTPGPELPVGANPLGLAIPVARLADMLLDPGGTYRFNGRTAHYPDIRLVHWAGGNPFHHHQQLNRLETAWRKPETVVVNETFWTPTARRADIVLPATTSLERSDIGGSSRDRFILAMHQAIPALHESRNDFEIFADLAERLGFRNEFTEDRSESDWIRTIYDRCVAAHDRFGVRLPPFEAFWQAGHVELPPPAEDFVLFQDFRHSPREHPLQTPSGRIELYSETLARFELADCGPHPRWVPPVEWLGAAGSTEYPLHLVSVQPEDRLHSQLDYAPLSRAGKRASCERILMHPADAAARGLEEGQRVKVYNERGACLAGLALGDGLTRGVVIMATGAWFDPDPAPGLPERAGNANVLTLDIGTSDLTQGPNAMSCIVQV